MRRMTEDASFRPIGLALAAVVAGVAPAASAFAADQMVTRAHAVDPTNDARRDEDPSLLLGPSEPVEPFAPAPARQGDLFEL